MRSSLMLVPLLLLPACGGESAPAGPKAEFVAAAEGICAAANTERDELGSPASVAEIPGFVQSVVLQASDYTAELSALQAPPEDEAALQENFLGPLQRQVQEAQAFAKQVQEASAAQDTPKVLSLLGQAPLDTVADVEFLRSYGLPECAELADTSAVATGG